MAKTLRYKPKFDPLKALLLDIANARSCDALLSLVVNRLTTTRQVALCRIWLARPICSACAAVDADRSECLHLAASAGASVSGETWNDVGQSTHGWCPIGHGKIGEIAATGRPIEVTDVEQDAALMTDQEWVRTEGIKGFGGQPLIHQGQVLGVLAVFTRMPLDEEWLTWLRMIADHAAAAISNTRTFERAEIENALLKGEISEAHRFGSFIGQSPPHKQILQQIDLAAATDAPVLIVGESGTGKERVAHEIHQRGARSDKPIIRVGCTSIPSARFASVCFGDAEGRKGRLEAADGGTLFLDEVAEIPTDVQDGLIRVLKESEYRREGEEQTRTVDVRIIASTSRDLKAEVAAGRFREDLYFGLNVFPLAVAPLRERKDDIPQLAAHFIAASAQRLGRPAPSLNEAALKRLQSYSWPGNIRELQNIIERGVMTSTGETLRIDLVSLTSPAINLVPGSDLVANDGIMTEDEMVELQKKNLRSALDRTGWKIYGPGGTAELLGLRPTTLASRIKKFGLTRR